MLLIASNFQIISRKSLILVAITSLFAILGGVNNPAVYSYILNNILRNLGFFIVY